jgi:NAD+ synthase
VKTGSAFSRKVFEINASQVTEQIEVVIREIVFRRLRRKGAVVAMSGGLDSSVTAALCARALGKDRVLGLLMPEMDSSEDSLRLGRLLAESLGIRTQLENISPLLEAAGCYRRRDAAIRMVLPEYQEGYKCKIALANSLDGAEYSLYYIIVQPFIGPEIRARLTPQVLLAVVAATNFKQRTRKMMEYHYADLLQYAVGGTPNRLEYDQGFFVKLGDGAADFKPIAHLYKSQVYQLAEFLQIPEEIQHRRPTTDTYSLEQSQEEFYLALPYEKMDLCLYGKNHSIPAEDVAEAVGLAADKVERIYRMIDAKRASTLYLHLGPLLVEQIREIHV